MILLQAKYRLKSVSALLAACLLAGCFQTDLAPQYKYDYLITGALVFDGSEADSGRITDVAIKDSEIAEIGDLKDQLSLAEVHINAEGLILAPGFIDPHTHADEDLADQQRSLNSNYLTQGVTTVFIGNDGGGPVEINKAVEDIQTNQPGTNVAMFVGHGEVRSAVVGDEDRPASQDELQQMRALVKKAMHQGALGLSAGLYYTPGSFAETEELIELAKEIAPFDGVYESHVRDESSYNIGLVASVEEAIEIGEKAGVAVHIAHIKALGRDVWGKSSEVIQLVEQAQSRGMTVTADQYPWRASGTRISNALIPAWAKDGGKQAMLTRLQDEQLTERLNVDITESLRIRGGGDALLITGGKQEWLGKTLSQIAAQYDLNLVDAARYILVNGDARVASFNMNEDDITAFMRQPWVMTSSDGTQGHPRKYASFPRKFAHYVRDQKVLSLSDFIYRSTGLTAQTFELCRRGYIRNNYFADIVLFDPESFKDQADFFNAEKLSSGVEYLFINGMPAIENGQLSGKRAGHVLKRGECD